MLGHGDGSWSCLPNPRKYRSLKSWRAIEQEWSVSIRWCRAGVINKYKVTYVYGNMPTPRLGVRELWLAPRTHGVNDPVTGTTVGTDGVVGPSPAGEQKVDPSCWACNDHSESTQSQTPWSLSPCFYKTPRPCSEELWIVADPHAHRSYFNRMKQRNVCLHRWSRRATSIKKCLKGLFCYRQCHQLMSTGNYSVNGRSVIFASIFNKRC